MGRVADQASSPQLRLRPQHLACPCVKQSVDLGQAPFTPVSACCLGFDTGPPGSASFCRIFRRLVIARGLPAGFPTPAALFQGLCSCGCFCRQKPLCKFIGFGEGCRPGLVHPSLGFVSALDCPAFGMPGRNTIRGCWPGLVHRSFGSVSAVRALMHVPHRSGQGARVSLDFLRLLVIFLGLPAGFPTFPADFRVCVFVAVFLSTETSL